MRRHWRKHCARYDACGRPVYFVQEDWYRNGTTAARPSKGNGKSNGKGHGKRG